ncbi:MAG: glycosyltransferase family 2 protein [Paludibacteraceae bacterium]|nr:glycosyltransferase family 2 protein [Paludibacteraceae bacterium]
MVRCAFIILTYKTYLRTETLVDELLSDFPEHDKIIVVDNASPNDAFGYLSARYSNCKQVDVIQSPENGGYAAGNNVGLRYAKKYSPEYVCIINNDIRFNINVIDKLIKRFLAIDDIGFIAPRQVDTNGNDTIFQTLKVPDFAYDIRSYCFLLQNKKHKYEENCGIESTQRVGIIPGAFLFTDYKLFESIGFFDEITFLYCEERFLGQKIMDFDKHCYIAFDLSYIHDHGLTISKLYDSSSQSEMILNARKKYIKAYRRLPAIQNAILTCFYHYHAMVSKIINHLKSIRQVNNS